MAPSTQLNVAPSSQQLSFSHPAGSTGALVPDLLQSGTVGPLLPAVKVGRQLQVSSKLNPEEYFVHGAYIIRGSTAEKVLTLNVMQE